MAIRAGALGIDDERQSIARHDDTGAHKIGVPKDPQYPGAGIVSIIDRANFGPPSMVGPTTDSLMSLYCDASLRYRLLSVSNTDDPADTLKSWI